MNRYFELHDVAANHHKFWEIIQENKVVNVHFGRIGTAGQTQVKTFDSSFQADAHVSKLIHEKRNKGYVEKADKASGNAAMAPLTSAPTKDKQVKPAVSVVPPVSQHHIQPIAVEHVRTRISQIRKRKAD